LVAWARRGYEDTAGATAIGASGGPIWKEGVRRVLITRSFHAVRCVTDLIDHMILETQKLFKGADMEGRCMILHDALPQWNEGEAQAYLEVKYPGVGGSLHQARGHHLRWHHLQGKAPWELAREFSRAELVRLR
jgi:hypothetical protein